MFWEAITDSGVPVVFRVTSLVWCTEAFARNMVEVLIGFARAGGRVNTFARAGFGIEDFGG